MTNPNYIQVFDRLETVEQNISSLLSKRRDLFKLLYYKDANPLSKDIDDETIESLLIEYGSKEIVDPETGNSILPKNPDCRIIWEPFDPDVKTHQDAVIHIYPVSITPIDIYEGDLTVTVDVIVHQSINKIKGGRRTYRLMDEIVSALNGAEIGLIQPLRMLKRPSVLTKFLGMYWGWSLQFSTGVSLHG